MLLFVPEETAPTTLHRGGAGIDSAGCPTDVYAPPLGHHPVQGVYYHYDGHLASQIFLVWDKGNAPNTP